MEPILAFDNSERFKKQQDEVPLPRRAGHQAIDGNGARDGQILIRTAS